MTDPIFPAQGSLTGAQADALRPILALLEKSLRAAAQNSSRAQERFLQLRRAAMEQMVGVFYSQLRGDVPARSSRSQQVLFTAEQLGEFGRGSVAKCLGPQYERFEGRRVPRIPNGDLQLMSRIVAIEARPGEFSAPASVTAEVDIPADAWYLRESAFRGLPYWALMEIALQPCGFLSAYLGSLLLFPPVDLYFRNLDGQAQLLSEVHGGRTLTTRAKLLSSTFSGETLIQRFAFEVYDQQQPVFKGESVFGYFTRETMARQVGLDGGQASRPLYERAPMQGQRVDRRDPATTRSKIRLASGRLGLLDAVFVSAGEGRDARGYLYARRENKPTDWFYPCHFFEDPVMPGSLGVEATLQALRVYALESGLCRSLSSPRFALPAGAPVVWKYRGQILPENREMKLEAAITKVEPLAGGFQVTADASLWADGIRIYEIQQAAISVLEG